MPSAGIHLLHAPGEEDGADRTFRRVIRGLDEACESAETHMYVWRSDAIGNETGEAVLRAAERGVKVRIIKDYGAMMYETIEMNRKSFFRKEISTLKKWNYRFIARSFPYSYVEDDFGFELGERIMTHPNVRFEWINKTHTKYHVFDEETILTGSINLEDRHRGYLDIMAELAGRKHVARFRERMNGTVPHDPGRPVDFVCNRHVGTGKDFEIKPAFLELISGARESIYVEMAYLGDEAITSALIAAARRGVKVSFLFSREANIGNDLNYRTMHRIYRRAPVEVFLSPKMIHSKLVLVDGETAIFGSCNFSVFSLQKAGELQVVVRDDPAFCAELRSLAAARMAAGEKVEGIAALSRFRPVVAALQQLHQKLNPN